MKQVKVAMVLNGGEDWEILLTNDEWIYPFKEDYPNPPRVGDIIEYTYYDGWHWGYVDGWGVI